MKKVFDYDESYDKNAGYINDDFFSNIGSVDTEHKKDKKMRNKSKLGKILILSVSGFCIGLSLSGAILYSTFKENKTTGVGGLELPAMPDTQQETAVILEDELNSSSIFTTDDVLSYEEYDEDAADETLTYQTYRVKSGDMISVIADKYNVTQDSIISVNNIKQSRLIQPGQYLKIPSMPGIIYTTKKDGETIEEIAKDYEINAEKCALVNYKDMSTEIPAGSALFLPDAELDWTTRQEINGDLFKNPLHCKYWLSSPYGWRDSPFHPGQRSFHTGIDMATGSGNWVYPAMDGKVIKTEYGHRVFGNYVVIQHHSGYQTLYAHLSSINCRPGNFVFTNTRIGRVGSTGMSTGPHLHFTVYKYGKTVNPLMLLN